MLDEKDLQAIAQLLAQQKNEIMQEVSTQLTQQKNEIMHEVGTQLTQQKNEIMQEVGTQFAQQKVEIMHEVTALMESYFDPKFNHLAEGLELLKEKTVSREEMEDLSDRMDVLEAVVKLHTREIDKLKKAQ